METNKRFTTPKPIDYHDNGPTLRVNDGGEGGGRVKGKGKVRGEHGESIWKIME